MINQLITYFYVLDDAAMKDRLEYLKIIKKNHSEPERKIPAIACARIFSRSISATTDRIESGSISAEAG